MLYPTYTHTCTHTGTSEVIRNGCQGVSYITDMDRGPAVHMGDPDAKLPLL